MCGGGRDWRLKQWSWVKLSVGSKQSSCLTKVGKWISDFPSHHTSIMINHVQFQIFCRSVQPTDHLWNDHKLMMKIMKTNRNEKWVFTEEKLHLLAPSSPGTELCTLHSHKLGICQGWSSKVCKFTKISLNGIELTSWECQYRKNVLFEQNLIVSDRVTKLSQNFPVNNNNFWKTDRQMSGGIIGKNYTNKRMLHVLNLFLGFRWSEYCGDNLLWGSWCNSAMNRILLHTIVL